MLPSKYYMQTLNPVCIIIILHKSAYSHTINNSHNPYHKPCYYVNIMQTLNSICIITILGNRGIHFTLTKVKLFKISHHEKIPRRLRYTVNSTSQMTHMWVSYNFSILYNIHSGFRTIPNLSSLSLINIHSQFQSNGNFISYHIITKFSPQIWLMSREVYCDDQHKILQQSDNQKLKHIKTMFPTDLNYHQTPNISCPLVGNIIVDNSDVVAISPVSAAPTTPSLFI